MPMESSNHYPLQLLIKPEKAANCIVVDFNLP